jgi:hypothetical protein
VSIFELGMVLGIFMGAGFVITLESFDRRFGLVDWLVERLDAWVEKIEGKS